ncbi:class I adenylate-forming enzyme family protein [Peterkaempfera bronchialis]|uniref:class I adenylate-forming enzyme family protein n=1 Tax=Peterkaempfera bronchialis TaxID=2126346 RepID=UPI003C2B5857
MKSPQSLTAPSGARPATLATALSAAVREHPGAAVVFPGPFGTVALGGRELHERALRVAAGLRALSVAPGGVVAVHLPAGAENAVAQAAVLLSGAVLLPVDPATGTGELRRLLRRFAVAALITPAPVAHHILGARALPDGLPELQQVIAVTSIWSASWVPSDAVDWAVLEAFRPLREPVPARPDDVCLLVGPRGVRHTHRAVLAALDALRGLRYGRPVAGAHLDLLPPGRPASVYALLRALVHGVPTVVPERQDPATLMELIGRHGVTTAAGDSAALAALLDGADRASTRIRSLREFLAYTTVLPTALVERAERSGVAAFRSYGLPEHPTIASGSWADPLAKRCGTVGRPVRDTEIRIVDRAGAELPEGQRGEIQSRGPGRFAGYGDRTRDTTALTADGWLRTGGVGHLDGEGFLVV